MSVLSALGFVRARPEALCGFVIYLTFGLSLDRYQFVFAYMSFAIAMLCVAAATMCATRPGDRFSRIALVTMFIFVGFGSYHWRLRLAGWQLAIGASVLALALCPDPANLVMGLYWPSARSLSGIGIFFGVICAALFANLDRRRGGSGGFSHGQYLICLVAVGQVVVAVLRYQDRLIQQEADFSLARAVLLKAYEAYAVDEPLVLKLWVDPRAVGGGKSPVFILAFRSWRSPGLCRRFLSIS